jgi:transposase
MQPAPKRGTEDEAIGRSRGGLSTKISIAVDALGNPVRFIFTAGQVADICQAEGLIDGFSCENLLADKGYDSDRFRASIADAGAEAVIPSNRCGLSIKSGITAALVHAMRKPSCRSHGAIPGRRHDLNVNKT